MNELDMLLDSLPIRGSTAIKELENVNELLEVTVDLGRFPEARFLGHNITLSVEEITETDISYVVDRIG